MNRDIDKTDEKPTRDEWLHLTIGKFGKWQCWISFLLSLFKVPICWVQLSIIFLAPPTQFWCAPPPDYKNTNDKVWLELIRPTNGTSKFDRLNNGFCEMKALNSSEIIPCPNGYQYNRTMFTSSMITEWDLVCGKERLVDFSQIIVMSGILIGNLIFGRCSDKYGRKPMLVICIWIQAVFGFIASWCPWYWGFVASRFIIAVANGGALVVTTVICVEIVGGKWRAIIPILIQAPFGLGYSLMAVLAYYLRDWRQFHYAMATISCVFILFIWLIPESPRWLFVKGRSGEAKKILARAAKFNGIDPDVFERNFTNSTKSPRETKNARFMDLFVTPTISRRTYGLCFIWLFSGMSFFTINQYIGHVGQNIFVSAVLAGLLAIPGQVLCLTMVSKLGRRATIALCMFVSAISFMSIIAFPKGKYPNDWQRMFFASIGIIGNAVSLCAVYVFTGELFPTVLRNTGLGLCSMCARLGSMLAPMVVALHNTAPYLPLLLLGFFNMMGMSLVLILPETKGQQLPELISDLEIRKRVDQNENFKEKHYMKIPTQENSVLENKS